MGFERKLKTEAYFIFKMTGPTGQFGLLVSAPSLDEVVFSVCFQHLNLFF